MLPERDSHDNFTLDSDGHAIPQADLLADWFIEHGDDPLEGPPEEWPDEYDSIRVALGPVPGHEDPSGWARRFDPVPPDEVDEIPF